MTQESRGVKAARRAAEVSRRVGLFSLLGNVFLAVIKTAAGLFSRSSAMLADGLNSAGDCVSSLTMLVGGRVASKPPDSDHPYGHGRAEYIFSAVMGLLLLVVAWNTLSAAVRSLMEPEAIQHVFWVLLVCGITICSKTGLYLYARAAGKKHKSPLIVAMSEDHRSDIIVTTGTVLGVLGSLWGLPYLDGVVGILISGAIALNGVRILRDAYRVLMGTKERASSPLVERARALVESKPEIDHLDEITATPVGTQFFIVVKFSVPGSMTVRDSHRIAKSIKTELMQDEGVMDVIVHVNPMEEHVGPSKVPGGEDEPVGRKKKER